MIGRCAEHGVVEGLVDQRGRLRCSVNTCRKLVARLAGASPPQTPPVSSAPTPEPFSPLEWKEAFDREDLTAYLEMCLGRIESLASSPLPANLPPRERHDLSRALAHGRWLQKNIGRLGLSDAKAAMKAFGDEAVAILRTPGRLNEQRNLSRIVQDLKQEREGEETKLKHLKAEELDAKARVDEYRRVLAGAARDTGLAEVDVTRAVRDVVNRKARVEQLNLRASELLDYTLKAESEGARLSGLVASCRAELARLDAARTADLTWLASHLSSDDLKRINELRWRAYREQAARLRTSPHALGRPTG